MNQTKDNLKKVCNEGACNFSAIQTQIAHVLSHFDYIMCLLFYVIDVIWCWHVPRCEFVIGSSQSSIV